jgi:hypothetical protein
MSGIHRRHRPATAAKPLRDVNNVNIGLARAAQIEPEQRWAVLAGRLDQRLVGTDSSPTSAPAAASVGSRSTPPQPRRARHRRDRTGAARRHRRNHPRDPSRPS